MMMRRRTRVVRKEERRYRIKVEGIYAVSTEGRDG